MSTLEALMALMLLLAAAALFVNTVPHIEGDRQEDLRLVLDAHGLGRSTDGHESRGYARWWDCEKHKCT